MIIHQGIDLEGVLGWPDELFDKWFDRGMILETGTGRPLSSGEVREHFKDLLTRGIRQIPIKDCDNFDYQGGGCRGHESKPVAA